MHGKWTSDAAYFAHHQPKACCSAHNYDADKAYQGPGLEATARAATCMFISINATRTLGGMCKATFAVVTASHTLDLRTE